MAKLSETRKLNFFALDNNFKTVDALTCLAFFALAEIPVQQRDQINKIIDPKHISATEWPCILERTSSLRKLPSYAAGSVQIMRFIYQTEIIDYDWYPQNPLERSKLDQCFAYIQKHADKQGLLTSVDDLKFFETYFYDAKQPHIGGFSAMTICDVSAFFAIMPVWQKEFEKNEEFRKQFPRMTKWVDRLLEQEDLTRFLNDLPHIDSKAKL